MSSSTQITPGMYSLLIHFPRHLYRLNTANTAEERDLALEDLNDTRVALATAAMASEIRANDDDPNCLEEARFEPFTVAVTTNCEPSQWDIIDAMKTTETEFERMQDEWGTVLDQTHPSILGQDQGLVLSEAWSSGKLSERLRSLFDDERTYRHDNHEVSFSEYAKRMTRFAHEVLAKVGSLSNTGSQPQQMAETEASRPIHRAIKRIKQSQF